MKLNEFKLTIRSHYLLAASGIAPGAALRDLNNLNAQISTTATQPPAPIDTEIDAYLANLQSQSTLAMIEDGLNRSARDFDIFLEENVTMEWDAQRQRIYEHFGLAPKESDKADLNGSFDASSPGVRGGFGRSSRRGRGQAAGTPNGGSLFGASHMRTSIIGTPTPIGTGHALLFADVADKGQNAAAAGAQGPDDRFLREKQGKFAEKVQKLNEARAQDKIFPVLRELSSVEVQTSDQQTNYILSAYKAMIEIVKENPDAAS